MEFREFTINNRSIREFEPYYLNETQLQKIQSRLNSLNTTVGKEYGFSFNYFEDGESIFKLLDGVGGYCGKMINAPHYIGLVLNEVNHKTEFLGAYYMQELVKALYDLKVASCWVTVMEANDEQQKIILQGKSGTVQYLLAFGGPDEKETFFEKHHEIINADQKYEQDPYGIAVINTKESRRSLVESIYFEEWGNVAPYSVMEQRGVLDILYYVRNSPSHMNTQPCRLILKNGSADLAIINPECEENYTDAGILMYTLQGLAKELSFPAKWQYIEDESDNPEYRIVASVGL